MNNKFKKFFYNLLHANYLIGVIYALVHFLVTPRQGLFTERRLWAYETWIILSFWLVFTTLQFIEEEKGSRLKKARQIIGANLILLVFPWGLFLVFTPGVLMKMFGLGSVYWRVLGIGSLLGALIYYYPYRFWQSKLARSILIFGFFDNLTAAMVVFVLYLLGQVPHLALGSVPLLIYFSFFFLSLFRYHRRVVKLK